MQKWQKKEIQALEKRIKRRKGGTMQSTEEEALTRKKDWVRDEEDGLRRRERQRIRGGEGTGGIYEGGGIIDERR
jgi:hypothetical protein